MNPIHQCFQQISPGNHFSYVRDVRTYGRTYGQTRVMLYAPPPHYKWGGGHKKENSTKNKNGDICFLNNFKFLYKIPFKVISVVTLCDFFYSRFKHFFFLNVLDKKGFSLKNKLHAYCFRCFCLFFIYTANSM